MAIEIDKQVYKLVLKNKQSSQEVERVAPAGDLAFLHEDLWLQDTVVLDWVVQMKGTWKVFLIFVYRNDPMLLIKRFIKTQISREKAEMDAFYMKRLAGKDQRGTLNLEGVSFQHCSN